MKGNDWVVYEKSCNRNRPHMLLRQFLDNHNQKVDRKLESVLHLNQSKYSKLTVRPSMNGFE